MAASPEPVPVDHREAVRRFVEQFAMVFSQVGVPRMASRVFAYVLADDAETYTAAELAAGLGVSPAAISGAVRYLVRVGLLAREREPGARADHYRVFDEDVWSAIMEQEVPMLERHLEVLREGAQALDPSSPGGRRVRETVEFYRFLLGDRAETIRRWREHRRRHNLGK